MSTSDFDPDSYIQATAPLLGLTIDAERRASVATFLGIAKGMAEILEAAPIPEGTLEPAPVFSATPSEPASGSDDDV